MQKMTLHIDGMMCGMCENHMNDAIRQAFPVKKVTSSHGKGETVILAEQAIDENALRPIIENMGYKLLSMQTEPYQETEKKGFFKKLFG